MRGRVISTGRAVTGKAIITIEVDGDASLEGEVDIHPVKEKRSLSANAYFYKLLSLMAEKLKTSVNELHNLMLSRYGYPEVVGENLVYVPLREDIDANKLEGIHLKATSHVTVNSNGTRYVQHVLMRGSHTFDTAEMSHLIDGTISEAVEIGVEVITEEEKGRMMSLYEKHRAK